MKFINYLESISGISIYPMISLMIFFIFFMLLGVRVYLMDKKVVDEIGNLPLDEKFDELSNNENHSH